MTWRPHPLPPVPEATAAQTRDNRTITIDFHDETPYAHLLNKAFLDYGLAFILSIGLQLIHQDPCRGGGCPTRHSHDVRVRLSGITIWRAGEWQGTCCARSLPASFALPPSASHVVPAHACRYRCRWQHSGFEAAG
jgi:hypothetical protein